MIGPGLVKDIEVKVQVIWQRLKAVSYRQNSYADLKRKDIEYEVGDKVFLNVSPWRKILRFGKRGKLSPRFIGLYDILERIGPVAYRLALPPSCMMCFMCLCFENTVQMNRISYQYKKYKYNRISPIMKSQRLFRLVK